jgi:thiol-disulfide isomerase/thioredoxin
MLELGTRMPEFQLPSIQGDVISSSRLDIPTALLVVFICPHCPFVRHIRPELAKFGRDYQPQGLAIVAINSNDIETYPQDGVDGMKQEVRETGYTFPYLRDESQEVAKAFRAACTPDFFLFDRGRKLVYRGQLDSSRPGNGVPLTGSDLRAAADAVLEGRAPAADQKPSIGCNIKWKAGNKPEYF